jgi:hypothetical protein
MEETNFTKFPVSQLNLTSLIYQSRQSNGVINQDFKRYRYLLYINHFKILLIYF